MRYLPWFVGFLTLLPGCRQSATDVHEAQQRLTAVPRWYLEEIAMDEVPVLQKGKHLPHISGVRFDVYLDWVQFGPDGSFEGHFKGAESTQRFQWEAYPVQNVIALRDSVTKTGGWNIYPRNVYEDVFEMETRSTLYDPPRVTKVALKYRRQAP
ncbi:hypothetical protein GCM10027275_33490 [Rhabdobacter roseus]|uniref:Uncharacterized protein n=1 Tax=Rhabdobacter roseus TaxID=1655419 RepID=A0A840TZ07_9BACT|nr:hypothetical protein [Rhabdobacter roseus]MBB5285428.1 hypothetical protein [Rhabdobacter roseus]